MFYCLKKNSIVYFIVLCICGANHITFAQVHSNKEINSKNEVNNVLNESSKKNHLKHYFDWWENDFSKKPNSWFATQEAIQIAKNILSWQDNGTGWPLMNTIREPFTGDQTKVGPWGKKASLNHSTINEIRFLLRTFHTTKNKEYLTALIGGLNYILDAQHKTGGWPHSYPYQMTDYSHYATYNDEIIADIMTFLEEVRTSPEYRIIGTENLKKVKEAYDKGLEFILKSQIAVEGELTAWAQQYDELTFEPMPARKFEPVAISGGESAGILLFLMNIRKPTQEVIQAIEAGVKWYREVQINGLELIKNAEDQYIISNPLAPALWARFYEIGTNLPVFAGRDGIVKYDLAKIERERRCGYAWYNYNGNKVFKRFEEWSNERKWDNQIPTNIDESKVVDYELPALVYAESGTIINTVEKWEKERRPEILQLFEEHQHGKTPEKPIKASFEVIEKDIHAMGGISRRTQVRINFPDYPGSPVIRVMLNIPANAKKPVPTLLHLSFSPNFLLYDEPGVDEGMAWDIRNKIQVPDREAYLLKDIDPRHFIEKGYGIATVYYNDIEPDFDEGWKYGVRTMFGAEEKRKFDEWGAIGAWSWGLSRVMDYLQTNPSVDGKQIAVSGASRLGKTTLWAVARDTRFSMAIPLISGEGGAAISRRNYGETIADLTNPFRYDYWFAPQYANYAFDTGKIPVDGHMLVSLIAPRPILQIVGNTDTWSDPKGEWISAKAAQTIYELYGLKGVGNEGYPEVGQTIMKDMGFFIHDGGHTILPEDFSVMTDFMDKHFTNQATKSKVSITEDEDLFTLDNGIVTAQISKKSGDLVSFNYKGTETLSDKAGHPFVYWSHDVKGAKEIKTKITIDPTVNNGEMAEVSVKGISGGNLMGHGPGAPPEGDLPVDIELRYCISSGDQGVYTYCIFNHQPDYKACDMTEARVAAKLQPIFNHIHIDDERSGLYPLLNEGIDKYVYTSLQSENRAYGYTSPEKGLGWFMIIPSAEFLSCGPTKAEFLAHGRSPTVLCYWKSSHYGYGNITLSDGEPWERVVGPLLLYVNEGPTPESMIHDAKKRLSREESNWPYEWVRGVPYANKESRSDVSGQIILKDSLSPDGSGLNGRFYVGLTKEPYKVNTQRGERTINWQYDAKYYQYWKAFNDPKGNFSIPNVPKGNYMLVVLADGVLGEYNQANIEVPDGGNLELGEIYWVPNRKGKQLWEIGIANRTATEFAGGDSYFRPGQALRFAENFPEEIDYIIGESDFKKDWYYAHMPYANDKASKILPFRGTSGNGIAASRTIHFQMKEAVSGQAFLRIAVSGTGSNPLVNLKVNGKPVEQISFGFNDGAFVRHQVHGVWREIEVPFDAKLLKEGKNLLTLEIPSGSLNNGIVYDYLRLELDEK